MKKHLPWLKLLIGFTDKYHIRAVLNLSKYKKKNNYHVFYLSYPQSKDLNEAILIYYYHVLGSFVDVPGGTNSFFFELLPHLEHVFWY